MIERFKQYELDNNREIKIGQRYRHFNGMEYTVISFAEHTETGEILVICREEYGEHKCYVRPLEMFNSEVDREKYPDIKQKYRFELIESN